jgi:hypothetical protein
MDYLVLEDFTPLSLQNQLETMIMYNDQVTWGYREQTAGVDGVDWNEVDPNIRETWMLQHDIFGIDVGVRNQMSFDLAKTNIFFLEHYLGKSIKMLQRIKANMTVKMSEHKGCHHPPHVDVGNGDAFSMVYYLHDNTEGDTIIFDKKYNPTNPSTKQHEGLKELVRVSPKKGRAVVFPSNRFHASSIPWESERRCIINYVFFADKDLLDGIPSTS